MRFLLDTNCWMQIARRREHAQEVAALLSTVPAADICITDYSLHSLLNVMRRHNMVNELPAFIASSGFGVTVEVVTVSPTELRRVVDAMNGHGLDVDDAYQYAAAELHNLALVSFDADFDRTPRGRLTPAAALEQFIDEQQRQQSEQTPPPHPGPPPP